MLALTTAAARLVLIVVLSDGSVQIAPTTIEQCREWAAHTVAGEVARVTAADGSDQQVAMALCLPEAALAGLVEEEQPAGQRR